MKPFGQKPTRVGRLRKLKILQKMAIEYESRNQFGRLTHQSTALDQFYKMAGQI